MKWMGLLIAALGLFLFAQVAQADWTLERQLTWTPGFSEDPDIAVDASGSLHVVWRDDTPGNFEIYYKKSTNGGITWTLGKRLSFTPGYSGKPDIAVDGWLNLHVVWPDDTPGNYEIYYRRSTDGGITWTPARSITVNSGDSWQPAIAVDSSRNPHLVWRDDTDGNSEIYYKKSKDGGATWTSRRRLTWTSGYSGLPDMAVDSSGYLHAVWMDYAAGNVEIYYRKSTDGGVTWALSRRLTHNSGYSVFPAIAVDSSGNPYVLWEDDTPGNYDIFYRKSPDGGFSWTSSKNLTWTKLMSYDPAITVDPSGNLHILWEEYIYRPSWPDDPFPEVCYKKSTNGGVTWTAYEYITGTSTGSSQSAIAADSSGNLHAVWMNQDYCEIFFSKGK